MVNGGYLICRHDLANPDLGEKQYREGRCSRISTIGPGVFLHRGLL